MKSVTYLDEHLKQIEAAAERIKPYVRRTPTLTTDLDPNLVLKPECFQVTGSFKPRGAFNAVLQLKDAKGVIAVSSGNHAQALALAAREAGLKALILIPEDANPAKVAATRALGAEVRQEGITFANREQKLREAVAETGLRLVHPFDDWDIIHGQGTAAREVFEDHQDVTAIVAPTGGGGLLSGTALAAKAHNPDIKVYGVEPEVAADARESLRTHTIQMLPGPPDTIADGVRTTAIGKRTFEVIVEKGLVDDIVTVSEEQIANALVVAWSKLKLAIEPTGALPLAAYLNGKVPKNGKTALILSGGNANLALVSRLLSK
jgi:threo-3-hydroxy-L-aspartate ammonia-lyase